MSSKVVGNQYIYNGPGYLDGKIQPVESVDDLNAILLRQRFIGLTVTVIHPDGPDSKPADYWLVQDPNEEEGVLMWERKTAGGGSDITVDTNTPDYITVTRDGDTFHVDAAGNFIGEIEDVKSGLTAVNERVDTIETRVESVETRVETVENQVTALTETVTNEVERLDNRIDAEVSAVTETITNEIQTVNERIDTEISAVTETITNEVQTINDRIDSEVSSITETITSEVERLDTRIDTEVSAITETITNEVERLDGRIDSEVSALTETITNEVERIDSKDAEQDERIDEISQWHIEKLSEDSGYTKYALVDGSGNTIGDTIDIVDEQYLEEVVYISAATEDDKAVDPNVVIGDPYLKFVWKYDIVTYVAIKDWVNDYFAGQGISISAGHEISVKLAEVEEGNDNYLSLGADGLKMNMFIEIDD